MQAKPLAEIYSSKSDDELIALASDADALLDEARPFLADELLRRNITVPPATERSTPQKDSQVVKLLRLLGAFVLNLVLAIFGTAIVESSIWSAWSHIGRARSISAIEAREWFLSLTIAVVLGIVVGKRWSKTAVWIWTLPVTFFALGVLLYGARLNSSVLVGGGYAEHFLAPNCLVNTYDCGDFFLFTIPAARAVAYSLAALLASYVRRPTA